MRVDEAPEKLRVVIQSLPQLRAWETDLRMVKSMMLYADEITLFSWHTDLVLGMLWRLSEGKKSSTDVANFTRTMADVAGQLFPEKKMDPNAFAAAVQELIYAEQEGFIRVETIPGASDWALAALENLGDDIRNRKLLREFARTQGHSFFAHHIVFMLSILSNERVVFPLFDDTLGALARETSALVSKLRSIKELESLSSISRAKHVSLVSNLFARLPNLEDASIAEIAEIRKEAENPLIRFRALMLEISGKIENRPWDHDFPHEVDLIIRKEVAPAILDLEEAMRSNAYITKLSRKFLTQPLEVAKSSAIGLALGTVAALPASISAALSVGFGAAITAYEAYNEWEDSNVEIRRNQFYFYYRSRERLKGQRPKQIKQSKK